MITPEELGMNWMANHPYMGRMYATSSQAISSNTLLVFQNKSTLANGGYDFASALTLAAGSITIPVTGLYNLKCSYKLAATSSTTLLSLNMIRTDATGSYNLNTLQYVNGSTSTGTSPGCMATTETHLYAGDVITFDAYTSSAQNTTVGGAIGTGTTVWASYRLLAFAPYGNALGYNF